MSTETIAAIATPAGRSAIAVVRISGRQALHIGRVLTGGRQLEARTASYCAFTDAQGDLLDRGILLYFKAPASATGEDVLELHGHGGMVAPKLLLERVLELGARLARPGEFSERAFLNGKLDLMQVEAVADLIDSQSRAAALGAVRSMEGGLSAPAHALAAALLKVRAGLEATIDFPEEAGNDGASDVCLESLLTAAEELYEQARRGEQLSVGTQVVIAGPTNAGKSTLLNALAGAELAIVTPEPGTTRDLVQASLHLEGQVLSLIDSAGLRGTEDPVEAEGVRRARAQIESADLVLWVQAYGTQEVPLPPCRRALRLYNKIDLHGVAAHAQGNEIYLSARTGDGLELLHAALLEQSPCAEGRYTARRRHVNALDRCRGHLLRARDLWQRRAEELVAEELALAGRSLDELTGTTTAEALLGEIFSTFCIGK